MFDPVIPDGGKGINSPPNSEGVLFLWRLVMIRFGMGIFLGLVCPYINPSDSTTYSSARGRRELPDLPRIQYMVCHVAAKAF